MSFITAIINYTVVEKMLNFKCKLKRLQTVYSWEEIRLFKVKKKCVVEEARTFLFVCFYERNKSELVLLKV